MIINKWISIFRGIDMPMIGASHYGTVGHEACELEPMKWAVVQKNASEL